MHLGLYQSLREINSILNITLTPFDSWYTQPPHYGASLARTIVGMVSKYITCHTSQIMSSSQRTTYATITWEYCLRHLSELPCDILIEVMFSELVSNTKHLYV